MTRRLGRPLIRCSAIALALAVSSGCSVRKMALRQVADVLAGGGGTWAADPDPQLVADAVPFALKTAESLLVELPDHRGLRLAACRGFTEYSLAFVESQARRLRDSDHARSEEQRQRALGLYERALGHCRHALERELPGALEALRRNPAEALREADCEDVPLLFWTGASWGAAIASSAGRVDLLADLPAVRALLERVLELDDTYEHGLVHQAMIPLAAQPGPAGGSPEEARRHLDRALELTDGQAASAYVLYAESVLVPRQDREGFETMLRQALEVDPDAISALRLANVLAQQQARFLLQQADTLFLEPDTESTP
ncbi:MAG: TRAP transporter TatT component family protein [Thermoanaerobaculia bacterium]